MSNFIQILLWVIFVIALILLISPVDILSGVEFDDWGYAIVDIVLAWVLSRAHTMKKTLEEKRTEDQETIDVEPKDE